MGNNLFSDVWDPVTITLQIVAIQLSFLLILGLTVLSLDTLFSVPPNLDQLFSFYLSFQHVKGFISVAALWTAAVFGSFVLFHTVSKAKRVLDFSCTRFFLHFIISVVYTASFPTSWVWWLAHFVSITVETLIGEYLCLRQEHQDLPQVAVLDV